jgi:hypothetical protein
MKHLIFFGGGGMQFAMFLRHKWPTGIAKSPQVNSRMLNVKSVARRHYQFHCRHWWPGHCIFNPRRLRQFCRSHRLMACLREARTLKIDGSNPARDVSNSGVVITFKAVEEKVSLRNEFFSSYIPNWMLNPICITYEDSVRASHRIFVSIRKTSRLMLYRGD